MNPDLALRTLSQIMSWDDERSRKEFRWLRLMARLKYDGYRDFQAGVRFVESLATWLQQFERQERETAYSFLRDAVVYIGPSEMQRLVEGFYPRTVRERLDDTVARTCGVPKHKILVDQQAVQSLSRLRRQTLFMALSDGARIDIVRHANVGTLTNEQLVVATQVDSDKWGDLLLNLRRDLGDQSAKFRLVYLLDDFMGTGTSLLRHDDAKQKWTGKLLRFKESVAALEGEDYPFEAEWELCIHHYIGTNRAEQVLRTRLADAGQYLAGPAWAKSILVSFGTVLPSGLPINSAGADFADFIELTRKYYDPSIRTRHTDVGGVEHMGLGYGGCALPLVLDHNTPNNSVALLWAETDGQRHPETPAHAMRPLFRRRQRHA